MDRRLFLCALAGATGMLGATTPPPAWRWSPPRHTWDFKRELVTVSVRIRIVDDLGVPHWFGHAYILTYEVMVDDPAKCAALARALMLAQESSEREFVSKGYRPG